MKKILLLMACILSVCMVFSACSTGATDTDTDADTSATEKEDLADEEKLSLVVTSFYQYDWLMMVLGDEAENFDITLLVDDGTDLHNYEPTVEDMLTITTSDMFLYTGGESDDWVADVIASGDNEDLNALSMMVLLDDAVLDHAGTSNVDGEEEDHDHDEDETETEEDHDHDEDEAEEDHDHDEDETETEEDHDHDEDETEEEHDHEHEDDEHVWLSLKNAMTITQKLSDEMAKLDADNADTYQANATSYIESLSELDSAYEELVSGDVRDTIIFADRFPFAYLVSDYNLSYYAAFEGCSTETEASFETIVWLTDAANEYDVNYLLIIESGTEDIANTIISGMNNSDCEILVLNSIQIVTADMINNGTTYYSIMEENLEVLKLALAN